MMVKRTLNTVHRSSLLSLIHLVKCAATFQQYFRKRYSGLNVAVVLIISCLILGVACGGGNGGNGGGPIDVGDKSISVDMNTAEPGVQNTLQVDVGETFDVDVWIKSDIELIGAECRLRFIPGLLRCDAVEAGDFFATGAVILGAGEMAKINNETGQAGLVGAMLMTGMLDPKEGIFASYSFTALDDGWAMITLDSADSDLRTEDRNTKQRTTIKVGNSNMVINDGTVTIGAGPGADPDLVVTGVDNTGLGDANYNVTYYIVNIGGKKATESATAIYIDNELVRTVDCPALEAGKMHSNTVGPFPMYCDQTVAIKVEADKDNDVSESKEGNNFVTTQRTQECTQHVDLYMNEVSANVEGNKLRVAYTVINPKVPVGSGQIKYQSYYRARPSVTGIYVDGELVAQDQVPSLELGDDHQGVVTLDNVYSSGQILSIKVESDINDETADAVRINNVIEIDYTCP